MDNDDMTQADALPATKGDLKAFATKDDSTMLRDDFTMLRDDFSMLRGEMASFRREAGLAYVQLKGELTTRTDRILAEFTSFRSQLLQLTGEAVSKADYSMRGQTILGHRVDELEKRVTVLESKPDRPT